jgi:hypothetical protein
VTPRELKTLRLKHRQDVLVLQSLATDWKAVGDISKITGLRTGEISSALQRLAKAKRALLYWDTSPRLARDGRPASGGRWLVRRPY